MKTIICLLCGGQSTEHEVSLLSALNVNAAISREKYDVLNVGITKDGEWLWYKDGDFAQNADDPMKVSLKPNGIPVSPIRMGGRTVLIAFGEGEAKPLPFDIIFPVMHGRNGEDGAIQGLAQLLGCPCVGCAMTASAICMDKAATKQVLEYEGIKTAPWITIRKEDKLPDIAEVTSKLGMPLFVKPADAGSSVGVVKVNSADEFAAAVAEAMKYDNHVLVEKCIVGREIECAVLGNGDPFCAVPGEIVPKVSFYSYEAKYTLADGAELLAPANLSQSEIERVQAIAKKAYSVIGCRGMSRVDFFYTPDGEFILNEINTIPGFTKISMFPRLMCISGIAYSELVEKLISLSLEE
ncbi:MAG: D-alanine--D-alanine ligase [Victivallales bacterium]|nr:D-alanine--D-alanine ligase [Victivallales bacterium]